MIAKVVSLFGARGASEVALTPGRDVGASSALPTPPVPARADVPYLLAVLERLFEEEVEAERMAVRRQYRRRLASVLWEARYLKRELRRTGALLSWTAWASSPSGS